MLREWQSRHAGSWDVAKPGLSTTKITVRRQAEDETTMLMGFSNAGVYLDLDKFYDSCDLGQVAAASLRCGYPPLLLSVGLQAYLAPRVLVKGVKCGTWMRVGRGIVPGCGQATNLARTLLYKPMDEVGEIGGGRRENMSMASISRRLAWTTS